MKKIFVCAAAVAALMSSCEDIVYRDVVDTRYVENTFEKNTKSTLKVIGIEENGIKVEQTTEMAVDSSTYVTRHFPEYTEFLSKSDGSKGHFYHNVDIVKTTFYVPFGSRLADYIMHSVNSQLDEVRLVAYNNGVAVGYAKGYNEGNEAGYNNGVMDGSKAGWDAGFATAEAIYIPKIEMLNDSIYRLLETIASVNIDYAKAKELIIKLDHKNAMLSGELTTTNEILYSLKDQREDLMNQVKTLTAQLTNSNSENAKLAAENIKLKNQVDELTVKINNLNEKIASLENEVSSLKAQIAKLNIEYKNVQKEANDLRATVVTITKEKTTLITKIEKIKGEYDALVSVSNKGDKEAAAKIADLKAQLDDLNKKLKVTNGQLAEANAICNAKDAQVTALENKIEKLNSDLKIANNDLKTANSDVAKYKNEAAKANDLYLSEKAKNEKLAANYNDLNQKYDGVCKENEALRNHINELNLKISDLDMMIKKYQATMEVYDSHIKALDQSIEFYKAFESECANMLASKDREIQTLNDSINKLSEKLLNCGNREFELEGQVVAQHAKIKHLEQDVADLKKELEDLDKTYRGCVSVLTLKCSELTQREQEIKKLNQQIEDLKKASVEQENTLNGVINDLKKAAQADKEEYENCIESLSSKIDEHLAKINMLTDSIDACHMIIVNKADSINTLKYWVGHYQDMYYEMEETAMDYGKKWTDALSMIGDTVRAISAEKAELNKRISDLTNEIVKLEESLKDSNNKNANLQDKLAKLNKEYDEVCEIAVKRKYHIDRLDAEIDWYKKDLRSRELLTAEVIKNYKHDADSLAAEVEKWKQKASEYEDEVNHLNIVIEEADADAAKQAEEYRVILKEKTDAYNNAVANWNFFEEEAGKYYDMYHKYEIELNKLKEEYADYKTTAEDKKNADEILINSLAADNIEHMKNITNLEKRIETLTYFLENMGSGADGQFGLYTSDGAQFDDNVHTSIIGHGEQEDALIYHFYMGHNTARTLKIEFYGKTKMSDIVRESNKIHYNSLTDSGYYFKKHGVTLQLCGASGKGQPAINICFDGSKFDETISDYFVITDGIRSYKINFKVEFPKN